MTRQGDGSITDQLVEIQELSTVYSLLRECKNTLLERNTQTEAITHIRKAMSAVTPRHHELVDGVRERVVNALGGDLLRKLSSDIMDVRNDLGNIMDRHEDEDEDDEAVTISTDELADLRGRLGGILDALEGYAPTLADSLFCEAKTAKEGSE